MGFALEKELMMIGRLLIAGFCGGIIGHERENRRKPAGVRTHTVVGGRCGYSDQFSGFWNNHCQK